MGVPFSPNHQTLLGKNVPRFLIASKKNDVSGLNKNRFKILKNTFQKQNQNPKPFSKTKTQNLFPKSKNIGSLFEHHVIVCSP